MKKRELILFLIGVVFTIGFTLNHSKPTPALPESEAELGRLLFFDKILSADYSVSCASCHNPEFGFADTAAFSKGIHGKSSSRNTPSVLNMTARPYYFWDGRAANLEAQVYMPIENPNEMGIAVSDVVKRLQKNKFYTKAFRKVYGVKPNKQKLGEAIAAFERTLETGNSPFDEYMDGDTNAISNSAKRGHLLFLDKAKCFDCHFSPDFTGDEFRNIGLFNGSSLNDSGRISISKAPSDLGKFKVPGLRNIALTAPYMHNGMFKSLKEVVEFYNQPDLFVKNSQNRDELLSTPLGLTEQEMNDLIAFLNSLTSAKLPK